MLFIKIPSGAPKFRNLITTVGLIMLWIFIYIIGCSVLLLVYIKRCVTLIKLHHNNTNKTRQYMELLNVSIKYTNCALIMFVLTLLCVIIQTINAGILVRNVDAWWSYGLEINVFVASLDCFINVIFTHFQFGYMHEYYIKLCDPFRVQINKIINNQINLTNIHLSTKASEVDIISFNIDTNSTDTFETSTYINGLHPTKSGDKDNLEPDSESKKSETQVYICRICPITLTY